MSRFQWPFVSADALDSSARWGLRFLWDIFHPAAVVFIVGTGSKPLVEEDKTCKQNRSSLSLHVLLLDETGGCVLSGAESHPWPLIGHLR